MPQLRITAKTIKATEGTDGEWVLDVLAIPYGGPHGGRDNQGEYFDERTDLMLAQYPTRAVFYYHGLDEPGKKETIGEDLGYQIKSDGVWLKIKLFQDNEFAKRVWKSALKGKARASSGSMPHIVPPIGPDGWIEQWPFAEISLMDETKEPVNSYAIARPALQAAYKAMGLDWPEKFNEIPSNEPIGAKPKGATSEGTKATLVNMEKIMDLEQLRQALIDGGFAVELVEEIIERLASAAAEGEEPVSETKAEEEKEEMVKAVIDHFVNAAKTDSGMKDVTDENKDAKIKALANANRQGAIEAAVAKHMVIKARREKEVDDAIKAAKLKAQMDAPGESKLDKPGGKPPGAIKDLRATDLRFAHLSASDMQLGYLAMEARDREHKLSPDYMKAMATKSVAHADSDPYADVKDNVAIKAVVARLKADEIMATDIAGQGTGWVAVQYATSAWDKARFNRIMEKLLAKGMMQLEVTQGNSVIVPLIGADPIVYASPQANDLEASNRIESTIKPGFAGTGRVTFTPGELKAAVGMTDIQKEDSIINAVAQVNDQLQAVLADTVDKLFLNGDTETGASTNINLIDGTPGTGVERPYYIASDGALKYALVTGSSTSSDLGTLAVADYMTLQGLLPNVVSEEEDDLLYIEDPETLRKTKTLAELSTTDVAAQYATIQGGKVLQIYGIDNVKSGFMDLANSAGKIPAAGGTLGRILLVYPKYWGIAWKRHINIETGRDIYAGADIFVASMRVGFKIRGAGGAVAGYNVTV